MAIDMRDIASLARMMTRRPSKTTQRAYGTVVDVDTNGVTWVQLDGSDAATPTKGSVADVKVGDAVVVTVRGGRAFIEGSTSSPAVGTDSFKPVAEKTEKIEGTVDKVADSAAESASSVKRMNKIVNQVREMARATSQYFWHRATDTDGAGAGGFVTDVPRSDFEYAAEHDFGDMSENRQYFNLLMNSLGLLIRRAVNPIVAVTHDAISFYDGLGDEAENITASFGTIGATVGKTGSGHLTANQSGVLINKGAETIAGVRINEDGRGQMFVGASVTSIRRTGDLLYYTGDDSEVQYCLSLYEESGSSSDRTTVFRMYPFEPGVGVASAYSVGTLHRRVYNTVVSAQFVTMCDVDLYDTNGNKTLSIKYCDAGTRIGISQDSYIASFFGGTREVAWFDRYGTEISSQYSPKVPYISTLLNPQEIDKAFYNGVYMTGGDDATLTIKRPSLSGQKAAIEIGGATASDSTPPQDITGRLLSSEDQDGVVRTHISYSDLTDGRQGLQLQTNRVIDDTTVAHALMLHIDGSGNRSVWVHDKAAWATGIGAVKQGGDTMSGQYYVTSGDVSHSHLDIYSQKMDRGANPSSDAWAGIQFCDKDKERIGYLELCKGPNGNHEFHLFLLDDTSAQQGYGGFVIRKPHGTTGSKQLIFEVNTGHLTVPHNLYINNGAITAYSNSGIDSEASNPSSTQYSNGVTFVDSQGRAIQWMAPVRDTNGRIGARFAAQVRGTNTANTYHNILTLWINRAGTATYGVSNAANFRSAIGAAASSDRRLKSNIRELGDEATDFIRNLTPCEYDIHDEHQVGLIAQDVHEVDPWHTRMAFETEEDIDGLDDWEKMEDGSPTWKLDYIRLLPPTIAALQKALDRIDELEARVEKLERML